MSPKTLKKSLYPLLTLIWIGVIFSFSLSNGEASTAQSGLVVGLVRSAFTALHIPTEGYNLVFWVRKGAHFSEYFVLGLLIRRTVQDLGNRVYLCLVFLVPVIDETLQLFSPGRAFSPVDMAIDAAGILSGILVLSFLFKVLSVKHKSP